MRFYTNFYRKGNYVYVRGYDEGKRFTDKHWYKPALFVSTNKDSEYKTIHGQNVNAVKQDSMGEARKFLQKYDGVTGFEIHGTHLFEYAYINEEFSKAYDPDQIQTINFDIEVEFKDGFPDPERADNEVTAITASYKGKYYTFGCQDYTAKDDDVIYIKCHDEHHLLKRFIQFWQSADADIVTGWNIRFFDIPYMVNRISKVLGPSEALKLSPNRDIQESKQVMFNREQQEYLLKGITVLDYLEVYKKFTYTQQESYKLDHIAHVELGERKLDYSEVDNLQQLYEVDYEKFIDYNIKDVRLVNGIEDKMKLIEMIFALSYDAKVNYKDTFTQVRMWDVIIHNYLMDKGIVVPQKNETVKKTQFAGAYVKKPQTGLHDWVMSFDLASLYPHLIMQYNISPETMTGEYVNVSMNEMLNKEFTKTKDCLAASGYTFRKDKQGFLPELMQKMYDDRVIAKKKMLEAQGKLEDAKKLKIDTKEIEKEISKYLNLQMAKKIQLNSAYGAIGNQYFRFFDVRQAESITLSGQLSIKWIEKKLNEYLNRILKTNDKDYIIAIDTDSVYVDFGDLVTMVKPKNPINFLDRVGREKIEPYINESYQELADMMNAYEQKMFMDREVIADKGIWTAKKRYVLNVHDNEGVRYTEPKLKVMGLETVKSSTPAVCRDALKEALRIILTTDEQTVQNYIGEFKDKFFSMPFEDVAFPRGISDLNKYVKRGDDLVIPKGTPIHVRGALIYNHLLKKHNLKRFEEVKDGEKIKFCYLNMPNPLRQNVLSVVNTLPKEFGIESYIDYETQFDKAFVEPLRAVLDSVGWSVEKETTLESFFV